ncbi:hypothetical protein PUR59_04220 [Streptomyces sp. SP18ES09]|uniref:hypothetical protein n=1 Tax=Streptomyces sp. SP18ES09 TaxID=3002532 RepID=UPI002E77F583|nr:hypothetical protein [Streptomyces sp. SP18ES09]MEE1814226.1 hypothetical protein [Streptomyces sp. SP18ES09]
MSDYDDMTNADVLGAQKWYEVERADKYRLDAEDEARWAAEDAAQAAAEQLDADDEDDEPECWLHDGEER